MSTLTESTLIQVLLTACLLPMVLTSGCSSTTGVLPPCTHKYYYPTECVLPIAGTNETRVVIQCVKGADHNVYASWEFWFGLAICIAIICGGIIFWRCIRFTQCYKKCKDSIRHEKNRTCARMCVRMCPCCDKCCEPYTRPTLSEIQKQQVESSQVSMPYHLQSDGRQHNHNHLSHVTARHDTTTPHSHHEKTGDKSLDEVCINSIQLI